MAIDSDARDESPLARLIEAIPDGISVLDLDGEQLLVNRAFCEMTGFPRSEMIGVGLPLPYWPPEHLPDILRDFERTITGEPAEFRLVFMRKNGERFPVSVHPGLTRMDGRDLVIATIRDLSEPAAREEELQLFHHIVDVMMRGGDLGWWMGDAEDGSMRLSDSCFTILGYEPGSWKPSYEELERRVNPEDFLEVDVSLRALLSNRSRMFDSEFRMRDQSDEWRWVLARGYVLEWTPEGMPKRVMGTLQDIDRLKRQEATLHQFHQLEVVGQMAGGIAHDFNNVLAVLSANLELLRLELDGQGEEQLADMEAALDRAAGLSRSLLAYARREKDEPRIVDLNQVLADFRKLVESAVSSQVVVQWDLVDEELVAELDPERLENAILNLAINASDAIDSGPGAITISTRLNRLDLEEAGRTGLPGGLYGVVSVADDGPGMPPDVRSRAAEPLFTTKPSGEGTGLGLSMARKFAADADGLLEIDSTPGRGTTVEMLFPLLHPVRTSVLDATQPPEKTWAGNEEILVVHDHENLAQFLSASLSDLGYRVWTAQNPRQALALVGEREIDLLVSDTGLPQQMTGLDLARRARVLRPKLQALFIAGHLDPGQQKAVERLGPVLRKPFEVQAFWKAVRRVLEDGPPPDRAKADG